MSAFFYGRSKTENGKTEKEAMAEKKYLREGAELESNYRFSTTRTDQRYGSTYLPQILSKFLHSFRPVDLTAGPAGDLPLQLQH